LSEIASLNTPEVPEWESALPEEIDLEAGEEIFVYVSPKLLNFKPKSMKVNFNWEKPIGSNVKFDKSTNTFKLKIEKSMISKS
jgi:hypothetical protein